MWRNVASLAAHPSWWLPSFRRNIFWYYQKGYRDTGWEKYTANSKRAIAKSVANFDKCRTISERGVETTRIAFKEHMSNENTAVKPSKRNLDRGTISTSCVMTAVLTRLHIVFLALVQELLRLGGDLPNTSTRVLR